MSHKNYTQFENNEKIKWYSSSEAIVEHKQVIIEGVRKDKSHYRIIVDEEIKDLINDLNNSNYRTLWSCQGGFNNGGTPYVSVSTHKLSKRKIEQLDKIILDYWKDFYRIKKYFKDESEIVFYGYPSEQKWKSHIDFNKKYGIFQDDEVLIK